MLISCGKPISSNKFNQDRLILLGERPCFSLLFANLLLPLLPLAFETFPHSSSTASASAAYTLSAYGERTGRFSAAAIIQTGMFSERFFARASASALTRLITMIMSSVSSACFSTDFTVGLREATSSSQAIIQTEIVVPTRYIDLFLRIGMYAELVHIQPQSTRNMSPF